MIQIRELIARRALKGLSQSAVAKAIDVHTATYQRFESSMGNLNLDSLEKLADLLDVESQDILDWRQAARSTDSTNDRIAS